MNANTPDKNADALLELARSRFDNKLTAAEQEMLRAAVKGEFANCTFGDQDTDPANAANWDDKRVIRADRLVWLCTDAQAASRVTHRGIHVEGARVESEVDLDFAQIPFRLCFHACRFEAPICMRNAQIPALNLNGTHTGPISAEGLKVAGAVFLRNGFKADGEVRLLGATIGGDLDCTNGQFTNPDGYALNADGLKVEGSVFLGNGFKAEGEVRLPGAAIGVILDCYNGEFTNPDGHALSADGLKVEGSVFLGKGFKAKGEVRLVNATVGGLLDCANGQFTNPDAYALNADRLKVAGHVFLRDGFMAEGMLDFTGATVDGYFIHRGVRSPDKATLVLRSARIAALLDEASSWPKPGNLFLQGLVYDELGLDSPTDAATRKQWLRLQRSDLFSPQPYDQLAKVLREAGHEEDAKEILIAKNEDYARTLSWRRRAGYWIFGVTTGYGHRPWRALWIGLAIVALGWLLFGLGFANDAMARTNDPDDYCPQHCALVYSIDTFVPLIDLRQATYWLPDAGDGIIRSVWQRKWPTCGDLLAVYLPVHIAVGWILTTLLVVGLTGVIRR